MPDQTNKVTTLLNKLRTAATTAGFNISSYGQIQQWPLIVLQRSTKQPNAPQVYLSSGIHGDEPAGPHALLELLNEQALYPEFNYTIFPALNPAGLSAGTRENPAGIDLNRDYHPAQSEEIQQQLKWIEQHLPTPLDLSIHLHEDWESTGFYLYELNFSQHPGYAPQIQQAVRPIIPIETATTIDGHTARNGLIRPEQMPVVEEGLPEALYIKQHFGGLNYTLETPSSSPLAQRIAAQKSAVLAALKAI